MSGASGPLRVAVLTISDAGSRGERADLSGEEIVEWVNRNGYRLAERRLVPDEVIEIVRCLVAWADGGEVDLVVTTGGTGLTTRDVTPEATLAAVDHQVPGLVEAIRAAAVPGFPRASLSRGVAGVRGRTLIVNLPGSPGGVRDGLAFLDQVCDHIGDLLRDTGKGH